MMLSEGEHSSTALTIYQDVDSAGEGMEQRPPQQQAPLVVASAPPAMSRVSAAAGAPAAVSVCVSDVRAFCATALLSPRVVPALCALLTSMASRGTPNGGSGGQATGGVHSLSAVGGSLLRTGSAPLSRQLTAVAAEPSLLAGTLGLDEKAQARFHAALHAPTSTAAVGMRRPVLRDMSNTTQRQQGGDKSVTVTAKAGDQSDSRPSVRAKPSASALDWARKWAPNAPGPSM